MICHHISEGATIEAKNYLARSIIESSSNPNTGNIQRLLDNINTTWKCLFEEQIRGKNEKGSLNSLVNLRNDFSHGGSVSASIGDVKRYFQDARIVLDWLEKIIIDGCCT
jgi:hypothetical protein